MSEKNKLLYGAEQIFPSALPLLLIFSRAIADISLVIIGLLFIYKSYAEKDWRWAQQLWFKSSLFFFGYLLIINTPFSLNISDSFFHSLAFMRWPIFAAALANWLLVKEQFQKKFLITLMLVFVFVFVDLWWQHLTGEDFFGYPKFAEDRLTGPFRSPLPGTLMLRVIFILLSAGLIFKKIKQPSINIFYALTILVMGVLMIFITGERMALLLFLLGIFSILLGLCFAYPKQIKQIILATSASVLLLFSIFQTAPGIIDRTLNGSFIKLEYFATSDYGKVFHAAYMVWQKYPVLGTGFHGYRQVCRDMELLTECSHAHNIYLQIAAETGVVGLLVFSFLVMSLFISALKPLIKDKAWYLAAISFSILIVSFWPFTGGINILSNWVASLVWLGIGWVMAISNQRNM